MTRFEIFKKGFQEGRDKFEALPSDEKPVAAIVIIGGFFVFIVAILGLLALAMSVLKAFWLVIVAAVGLWYFWPRIVDLIKKRG